jgi:hypothetical protein
MRQTGERSTTSEGPDRGSSEESSFASLLPNCSRSTPPFHFYSRSVARLTHSTMAAIVSSASRWLAARGTVIRARVVGVADQAGEMTSSRIV